MASSTLKNINYQIGKLCRLGSRKAKLMAISNRRKQQLRHLGERVYIFKALQQDDDIWEKDEISQLLLTIADLDQEQEMIIDEINEIKAEIPPEETTCECHETCVSPEPRTTVETSPDAATETVAETTVEAPQKAEQETEKPEETAAASETSDTTDQSKKASRRPSRKKGTTSKNEDA